MSKLLAIVKFNNGEAFVLEKPIQLVYTKYNNDTIIGTDGIFLSCYELGHCGGNWKAFEGREFDLPLVDGSIEHCYGQWWDAITPIALTIIGDDIISVVASDIARLKDCYVFNSYYGIKNKIQELRETYKDKIYEYYEYDALLKNKEWDGKK